MGKLKKKIDDINIRKLFPYFVFLIVYLTFAITQRDKFLSIANMKNIVQQTAVMAIVAVGQLFVIVQGEIDLSVSSIMGLAGIICADIAQHNIPMAIAAGILIGTSVGLMNGLLYTYLRIPSLIATVGMHMILVGFMRIYFGSESRRFSVEMKTFGKSPKLFIILMVIMLFAHILLKHRPFGRYCIAIGGDRKLCQLNGIPVKRIHTTAFLVSGTLAAIAGIVKGFRIGFASPAADIEYSFKCITALAISGASLAGGVGSVFNTMIGALTITMLSNGLMVTGISSELHEICTGVFLILSVYISLKREHDNNLQ